MAPATRRRANRQPAPTPTWANICPPKCCAQELSSRPHVLVGAAVAAAETGSIPTIAGRTVARRAATVLTHKAEQAREEAEEFPPARRPRRWLTLGIAAAALVVLAVGLWLGYAWTQTRYYIGEFDQRVAIYNGVSQRLGPIQLSTLEAVTDIRMDSLPQFSQQRVRQTVPARDLYDAQRIVKNLERTGTTAPVGRMPDPVADPHACRLAGYRQPPDGHGTARRNRQPRHRQRPTSTPQTHGIADSHRRRLGSATPTATCEGGQ